jgi:hypothetical protein
MIGLCYLGAVLWKGLQHVAECELACLLQATDEIYRRELCKKRCKQHTTCNSSWQLFFYGRQLGAGQCSLSSQNPGLVPVPDACGHTL